MIEEQQLEDLKYIQDFGSDYFKGKFFKPKEIVVTYNKYHIPIGKTLDGKIYRLDTKESFRCVLVGATRSGKTFTIREIMDRLYLSGRLVLYLTDIKNEFWSSRMPVQSKFESLLLPNEKPQGFKVVTLRPTFFKQIDPKIPQNNFWFSMNMNNITKGDFFTLMKVNDMTSNQQVFMDILYEKIEEEIKKNREFNLDLINECIDELEDFKDSTKLSMKNRFRPLKNSHFFEPEYERDVVSLLQRGYIPAINYESFDSFGKSGLQYPEMLLSMVLRDVVKARRAGKIKPIFIVLDEALRFVSKTKTTSLKDDIGESIELDTRYGINYLFAVQDLDAFEDRMLKNCRYIMIPRTADVGTIQKALVNMSLTKNVQTSTRDAMAIKNRLRKHKYAWLVMDRFGSGSYDIIIPLAPLSNHVETSD